MSFRFSFNTVQVLKKDDFIIIITLNLIFDTHSKVSMSASDEESRLMVKFFSKFAASAFLCVYGGNIAAE